MIATHKCCVNFHISTFSNFHIPVIFLISFNLLSASSGDIRLISRFLISSRICLRTGSSSWKKLSWYPSLFWARSPTGFAGYSFRLLFSIWARISSARATTLRGIPAIWATWIPKLWLLPPGTSFRKKMMFFPISLMETLKFRIRPNDFSISFNSW